MNILRESPLGRMALPDAGDKIEGYLSVRRRQGESMGERRASVVWQGDLTPQHHTGL